MTRSSRWDPRFDELDDFAMGREVSVLPLFETDYLTEFYDFYRIRQRTARLIPSGDDFTESLRLVAGDGRGQAVAQKAESLFGLPRRICYLEDDARLREELGGRRGLSGFFFVFDLMFCEYDGFTLCFLSGTNN